MNVWDDLPNGKRIDAVLAHYKVHPKKWNAKTVVWDAARYALRRTAKEAAREAAWVAARDAAWAATWEAIRNATRNAAIGTAWGATQALVAWDEAGDMLDMSVEEVQALATVGIHAAVLLLPAVIAMKEDT